MNNVSLVCDTSVLLYLGRMCPGPIRPHCSSGWRMLLHAAMITVIDGDDIGETSLRPSL